VARVGDRRSAYRVLVRKSEGKSYLKDVGIDGRILLKWVLTNWNCKAGTGLTWLSIETGSGLL